MSESHFPPHANMIMSQSLADRLRLPNQPVWVTLGIATDTAFIQLSRNPSPLIRISSRLAERLKIQNQKTLNVRYDSRNRRLHFGPLLGVLINRNVEGSNKQLFGLMARFLEECALASTQKGVCLVVFPPENIHLARKTVRGWEYRGNQWLQTEFPLPDAIYNRITSRRIERQPELQQKLRTLKNTCRIPFFNETFLNKREVHELLIQDEKMHRLLPETQPYHPARLRNMLEKYGVVYLKPTNGSLGQGIIRVTVAGGRWVCQYPEASRTVTRMFHRRKEALRHLRRRVSPRYIIQRGLNLVTCDGRPVDFRVLVQKNGKGQWAVTSIVGRIANDQDIVSNLARGGTLRKAADVLSSVQAINKPTIQHLRQRALEISQTFEQLSQGHFAELGVDLVLDKTGHLWLIELNSKPSKTDETVTNPSTAIRPSVNRLIEYVTYITGWAPCLTAPNAVPKPRRPDRTRRKRR
ncbi:YheC/YheD family protein [Melghirimyces profundicolus]|nr:YheC/YheD family protein [Melghirimyces profundicolus]